MSSIDVATSAALNERGSSKYFLVFSAVAATLIALMLHASTPMGLGSATVTRWSAPLGEPSPPAAPSVFQQEAALGPRALLNRWNPLIEEAAQKFGVPSLWIRAVMRNESGGRTMLAEGLPITSYAGAMGVMQLMPETYGQMAKRYGLGNDPFDAHDNIFAAAAYLRWLHGRFGFPGMFAAYNDGPTLWTLHLQNRRPLPLETSNYLKSITGYLKTNARAVFTRPNGHRIAIDASQVTAVRAAFSGEFAPTVRTVIKVGKHSQGVREDLASAMADLRKRGAPV